MKKPIILTIISIILIISGIAIYLNQDSLFSNVDPANLRNLTYAYVGTLPCADCSGITTEIFLNKSLPENDFGVFSMVETYRGKSNESFPSDGTWKILRGLPEQPRSYYYELTFADGSKKYFAIDSTRSITLLDGEKNRAQSGLNYSLEQVTK